MNVQIFEHLFARQPDWQQFLRPQLEHFFTNPNHGHFQKWNDVFESLSYLKTSEFNFSNPVIEIGSSSDLSSSQAVRIKQSLQTLHPWRKGPFNYFGIHIDSEWQCQMKWDRIAPHLNSIQNKKILDVGCGNGYFMLRMLGEGAKTVIGVDPTLVFFSQFYTLTQCLTPAINAHLLPMPFEDLNEHINGFDYVLSMGVLYHRREPLTHLQRLFQHLQPGGTVIIETLILNTEELKELIPENRYAGMKNVWSIPSPNLVQKWLGDCGFVNLQLHDIQKTTLKEQRATAWMDNYSLKNFLDENDFDKTVEGYPAPTRAIFSADKPA
ncbi:MAG: tRNA 5-methoxyuridine(34)/uridine 5-oxyacetic acid(34) synthase CmoB [Pseudomonadota bacterium]